MIYQKWYVREGYEPPEEMMNRREEIEGEIQKALDDLPYTFDSVEYFGGNPACGPYVVVECRGRDYTDPVQKALLDVFYKFGIKRV